MIVLAPDFMTKICKTAAQHFHCAVSNVFDSVKSIALWSANIRTLAKDHKGYGSAATIAPSEPLFKQLGWMSIEQRIKYHKYILVSKCLKNEAPVYLINKNQYLSDQNPYSLRNVVSKKLQIPKAKTKLFKKPFTYSGPRLWNELPFSIRQASSHNAFKIKVKSLILNDDVP